MSVSCQVHCILEIEVEIDLEETNQLPDKWEENVTLSGELEVNGSHVPIRVIKVVLADPDTPASLSF